MKHSLFILILFLLQASVYAQDPTNSANQFSDIENLIANKKPEGALLKLQTFADSNDLHLQTKAFSVMGQIYLAKGETELAIKMLNRSLERSRSIFNQREEVQALYHLARASALSDSFEQAKKFAENAALLAQTLGDELLEYRTRNFLTYTYYMTETDFYKILDLESDLFRLVNNVGNEQQIAAAYNNLGYDLTVAGSVPVDSTIHLMKTANNLYAEMEDNNGRWYTLMNLTWQHRLKHDLNTSRKFGEMSLSQAIFEENRHAVVEASFHLGETLMEMNQMNEALKVYEIGKYWRGSNKDRDRYVFDVFYAKFLWKSGQKNEAIQLLEKAVEWLINSEVFYEMHGRALLASFYLQSEQPELAKEQLDIFDNPRHNYISLESRCISMIVRAQILKNDGQQNMANALITAWLNHTNSMGMKQLNLFIKSNFPTFEQ